MSLAPLETSPLIRPLSGPRSMPILAKLDHPWALNSLGSLEARSPHSIELDEIFAEPIDKCDFVPARPLKHSADSSTITAFFCGPVREEPGDKPLISPAALEVCSRDPESLMAAIDFACEHLLSRLFVGQRELIPPLLEPLVVCKASDTHATFQRLALQTATRHFDQLKVLLALLPHAPFRLDTQARAWNRASLMQTAQIQANTKMEDALFCNYDPRSDCLAAGVFDGHGGNIAVRVFQQWLPALLQGRLALDRDSLDPHKAAAAIHGAFKETDERWMQALANYLLPLGLSFHPTANDSQTQPSCASQTLHLTEMQRKGLSAQGACAIVTVVHSKWAVIGHVGDCRALLVYYPKGEVEKAQFEWLNSPHFPSEISEWSHMSRRTAKSDRVPARPSFESLSSLVHSTGRSLSEEQLEDILSPLSPGEEPFASFEEAYDYLASSLDVYPEQLFGCVPRVAGTLMVSRALGDSYLKRRSFAFDRFHKAEYVSCEPEMTLLYAQESLQDVIVMASDGIWDLVSAETIRDCIVDAQTHCVNAHDLIIQCALDEVVALTRKSIQEILSQAHGPSRRKDHDDMTLVILWLSIVPGSVVKTSLCFSQ